MHTKNRSTKDLCANATQVLKQFNEKNGDSGKQQANKKENSSTDVWPKIECFHLPENRSSMKEWHFVRHQFVRFFSTFRFLLFSFRRRLNGACETIVSFARFHVNSSNLMGTQSTRLAIGIHLKLSSITNISALRIFLFLYTALYLDAWIYRFYVPVKAWSNITAQTGLMIV